MTKDVTNAALLKAANIALNAPTTTVAAERIKALMSYCENADEREEKRCEIQCEKCRKADLEETADARSFRDNMERECKP